MHRGIDRIGLFTLVLDWLSPMLKRSPENSLRRLLPRSAACAFNTAPRPRVTLAACLLLLLLSAWSARADDPILDERIAATLERLESKDRIFEDLSKRALGVLVFPRVFKGAFFFGGATGNGALLVDGEIRQYYRVTGASFGLQFGGRTRSEVLFFMSREAFDSFYKSDGWEVGIDGNVTAFKAGGGVSIDTTNSGDAIIGVVLNNRGLIADLSFKGARYWRLNKAGPTDDWASGDDQEPAPGS